MYVPTSPFIKEMTLRYPHRLGKRKKFLPGILSHLRRKKAVGTLDQMQTHLKHALRQYF